MDFRRIKERSDMVKIVSDLYTKAKIFRIGTIWRVNPAWCCGHRDCLSIRDNRFFCYSCHLHGDILDAVSIIKGLTLPESARFLQERYLGETKQAYAAGPAHSGYAGRVAHNAASVEGVRRDWPAYGIKDDTRRWDSNPESITRARGFRGLAMNYFHKSLMRNPAALDYLISVRKRDMKIIEDLRIGYTDSSLLTHIRTIGMDPIAFKNIGLIADDKRGGLRDFLPRNCFVFPHLCGGQTLALSVKDPSKRYSYQIPKRYFDPEWIVYHQDGLTESEVWVCEGEHDCASLIEAGISGVVATMGGFGQPELTMWIQENAAGKVFFLAFDQDDGGERYRSYYRELIQKCGGEARIVRW